MMTARSRGQNQEWDPMRDDFDNTNYDPQHPNDNSGGYVNLDHCRLYITNIPMGLNDEGLTTAFSRFGSLTEVYIHKDPEKRYGLVAFETPGEAKLAMMKLNRTEPLRLNINIAYKSKAKNKRENTYRGGNSNGARDRDDRSFREDSGSNRSQSNSRRQDLMANGDNMEDLVDDDPILSGSLEPDVNLKMEELRLEHLKLQEAQVLCKRQMLLLKQAEKKSTSSSRCILPDGRIVVRNVERGENQDGDASFGAGAGDAPKIPGLQSFGACVACGERAAAFCAGCRVTPYCSPACQRRDWLERHNKVCHNLKRQSGCIAASRPEPEPEIPTVPPLRRPRSPEPAAAARSDGSDRGRPRRFGPPGNAMSSVPTTGNMGGSRNAGPRGFQNRANQSFDSSGNQERNQDNKARFNRSAEGDMERSNGSNDRNFRDRGLNDKTDGRRNQGSDGRGRNQDDNNNRQGSRPGPSRRPQKEDDEDWGPKPEQKPEPKPAFKPKSPVVQKEEPRFETQVPAEASKAKVEPRAEVKSPARPLASPSDVQPVSRKLVPKNCAVELLPVGATFLATVDFKADDADGGYVCVTISEEHHADVYPLLFEPLAEMCEASELCEPRPGETFGYLDVEDGGWYRARCLTPTSSALIDAGRCLTPAPANCRRLPAAAADIPEFCCRINCDKLQLNDKAECTVVSKSNGVLTISVVNQETGARLGTGTARRWLPATPPASAPAPAPAPQPATSAAQAARAAAPATPEIPQVPRPPVANNSTVLLVDATEPTRVFVRPASRDSQAAFDDLVCEVAMYGADESTPRLTELPVAGQTVIARFTDGNHYRALVQRVSSKHRRCLLEYVEYGNVAAVELDNVCPCPPQFDLANTPTLASLVALDMKQKAFTEAATEYLDKLKEEGYELTLTIPSGEKSGGRGTAVRLAVIKSGDDVNRAVDQLSTPEWKKLLERGGDVLQVEKLQFEDLQYVDPPTSGCQLEIVDSSTLSAGVVSGHERGAPHALKAYRLPEQLEEYCNSELAKDPYLPNVEELCIAKCPEKHQWLRAVLLEQVGGAGGREAQLLFYDYGHVRTVPVHHIRKMMPEFVRAAPAAACSLEIKDFPREPTPAQLSAARRHMQLNERGAGALTVARCRSLPENGEYLVDAPDLIRAMMQSPPPPPLRL